jgi:large subunit ribosomal protein L15
MAYRKRKKNTRMRGSHTHGWGEKKKHRGSGHRGGKGRAGSGKRADSKKPSFWKEGRFHKIGFISRSRTESNPINVGDINLMIEQGTIAKKGNSYEANLTDLGYTKLLSKGKSKYPVIIIIDTATEKAVQKITAAGGKVTVAKTE